MTARPLTDAQLRALLAVQLPAAEGNLRGRILEEIEATPQQRRLPSFLGALSDANPRARRRALLLAAVLTLALSLTIAAVVGSLLRQRSTIEELSLEPPADVDAFVLASYGSYAEMPALMMRFEWVEDLGAGLQGGTTVDIFYHDGQGAVRNDHPGSSSPNASIWTAEFSAFFYTEADAWILYPPGEQDPRSVMAQAMGVGVPNCGAGWRHLGVVDVIDRPTHHVACESVGEGPGTLERQLWIDIATGLVLRTSSPAFGVDDRGSQVPLPPVVNVVTALEIGPQPADLFVPDGPTMTACEFDPASCESAPPFASPSAEPTPLVTPPPAETQSGVPQDLDAFVASVQRQYVVQPALDMLIEPAGYPGLYIQRWTLDGNGNRRTEYSDPAPSVIALSTGGRSYMSFPQPDGTMLWRDYGPIDEPVSSVGPLGLPLTCGGGWKHLGVDLVLGRAADHIACGFQEFWIDREWLLVTRSHDRDPLLGDPAAGVSQVLSVTFGPQPAELFEPPPPEVMITPPPG